MKEIGITFHEFFVNNFAAQSYLEDSSALFYFLIIKCSNLSIDEKMGTTREGREIGKMLDFLYFRVS